MAPPLIQLRNIRLGAIAAADRSFQHRVELSTETMRDSLAERGQIRPVVLVAPTPYRIIDGYRRIIAMRELGWQSLQAIVLRHLSDDQAFVRAFLENVGHQSFTATDKANAMRAARERGWNWKVIAHHFGLSQRQVHRYQEVLNLPPPVKQALSRREITMNHARVLVDVPVDDLEEWMERVRGKHLSAPQLRRQVTASKRTVVQVNEPIRVQEGILHLEAQEISVTAPLAERQRVAETLTRFLSLLLPEGQ